LLRIPSRSIAKSTRWSADSFGMTAGTPKNVKASAKADVIISEFADDPEMAELVDFFLSDLEKHVTAMANAWQEADHEALRGLAHQLKGAAGGYGFPTLTKAAAAVEASLLAKQAELSQVGERVDELIVMCRKAAAGNK
jgi:HPt (histidine-containing phosphotransfer) domain-containing protein